MSLHSFGAVTYRWLMPVGLSFLGLLFILNSRPFMFPGYDMWWHMGMVDAAHLLFEDGFPVRYTWHLLWNKVFAWLPATAFFNRALLIHHVQFLLTSVLVGISGYLVLRAVLHRVNVGRSELAVWAILGVAIWMVMHGTYSSAVYGGAESHAVLPWILWYSINYQISLPFSLLASALVFHLLEVRLSGKMRLVSWLMVVVCLIVVALAHVAELPYFLLMGVIALGLYAKSWVTAKRVAVLLVLALVVILFGLNFSYRTPELIQLIINGAWSDLAERISRNGHYLVNRGGNRAVTGWNTLHMFGLAGLVVSMTLVFWLRLQGSGRPILFLLLTALIPSALLFVFSAGLLSMITHAGIAWRFTFASFLFVGMPLMFALVGVALRKSGVRETLWLQAGVVLGMGMAVYGHSRWFDQMHVTNRMAHALTLSQKSHVMYFDLLPSEYVVLDAMHAQALKVPDGHPLCLDVFSAYYLFFLKDFREIYMPGNINRLPGVKYPKHQCAFPRDGPDLARLGISPPPWRYRLVDALQH